MSNYAAAVSETSSELSASLRAALIDERGQLEAEVAAIRPKIARAAAIDKVIRSWCEDLPGEKVPTFEGNRWTAVVGMAAEQTKIRSITAVFMALKRDRFLELCSLTLEKLKSAVTAERFDRLTVKTRTGTRSITLVPKL